MGKLRSTWLNRIFVFGSVLNDVRFHGQQTAQGNYVSEKRIYDCCMSHGVFIDECGSQSRCGTARVGRRFIQGKGAKVHEFIRPT